MNFEFNGLLIENETTTIELLGSGIIELPEKYIEVVVSGDNVLYFQNTATLGDFLISFILLMILAFLICDFLLSRILPKFLRFWQ